jgi:hypothetical protein
MTLVVFGFGALGPQEIKCAAARAFNLQRLINTGTQLFAAGSAADFVHGYYAGGAVSVMLSSLVFTPSVPVLTPAILLA